MWLLLALVAIPTINQSINQSMRQVGADALQQLQELSSGSQPRITPQRSSGPDNLPVGTRP